MQNECINNNETIDEYFHRLIINKDKYALMWNDIADLMNSVTGENTLSETYRSRARKFFRDQQEKLNNSTEKSDYESDTTMAKLLELQKIKTSISDERRQVGEYYRRISREESIKEIAIECANRVSSNKILPLYDYHSKCGKSGILLLSDWHYGIEFSNSFNSYSPEICASRLSELKQKVIDNCRANGVTSLKVVDLGDLISGKIHAQIRFQNRQDVISQTMNVAEIMSELLADLSEYFTIDYYSCVDNHSRIEPNKKESLQLESLCRIIPWYLKQRLADNVNITFNDNYLGDDIVTFDINGFNVIGVHGDKDSPASIVRNLSAYTRKNYDLVVSAHLHHFQADEQQSCMVIQNGSLMSTDDYACGLRLSAKPSQTLIIVGDSPCDVIYRIVVS